MKITIEQKECSQCGFKWYPRVEKPKQCPNCKRYDWAVAKKGK